MIPRRRGAWTNGRDAGERCNTTLVACAETGSISLPGPMEDLLGLPQRGLQQKPERRSARLIHAGPNNCLPSWKLLRPALQCSHLTRGAQGRQNASKRPKNPPFRQIVRLREAGPLAQAEAHFQYAPRARSWSAATLPHEPGGLAAMYPRPYSGGQLRRFELSLADWSAQEWPRIQMNHCGLASSLASIKRLQMWTELNPASTATCELLC